MMGRIGAGHSSRALLALMMWLALAVAAGAAAGPAPPPGADVGADVAAGATALAAHRFDEARTPFERALAVARTSKDQALEGDLLFYLGLTAQTEALLDTDPDAKQRHMREALERYEARVALSASGPTLNNLGHVYTALGRYDDAALAFEQAIALGDERQPLYHRNYAEWLWARRDVAGAVKNYRSFVDAQPDDLPAHDRLLELCRSLPNPGPERAAYLWDLQQRGACERAQAAALEILAAPDAGDDRDELLALVAVCLANQYYAPTSFEETPAGQALVGLQEDPALADGIRELRRLHSTAVGTVANYPWWRSRGQAEQPPRGVWPLEAFARLARSLGARYRGLSSAGNVAQAEAYSRLAVNLMPEAPDAKAVRQLVDLLYEQGKLDDLNQLAHELTPRLVNEKLRAYERGDWLQIQKLHVALGTIYASLGQWGDSNTPTSAIFHLERARASTERFNALASAGEQLSFEPELLKMLADGYRATDRLAESAAASRAAAIAYSTAGNAQAALEAVKQAQAAAPGDKASVALEFDILVAQRRLRDAQVVAASLPGETAVEPGALVDLGLRLMQKGDLQAALKTFDRAVASEPSLAKGYYFRGLVQMQLRRRLAAKSDFEKALELSPAGDEVRAKARAALDTL